MYYTSEKVVLLKSKEEQDLNNKILEIDNRIRKLDKLYAQEKRRKYKNQNTLNEYQKEVHFLIIQRNKLQDLLYRRENKNEVTR